METTNKRFNIQTLGCKVNKYDSEAIVKILTENNFEEVGNDDFAEIYIINTCSVTNLSEKKSRQIIRRAKKINPEAIVIACGCYSQVSPEEVANIEEVDIVIGTKDRMQIIDLINNVENSRNNGNNNTVINVSDIMEESYFEPLEIDKISDMTRAYLKIQEGCNQFCAYCIIPYTRGKIRSRNLRDIIEEVEKLAENGIKEVVLAGIHIASYGKDLENIKLLDVIKLVAEVEGIERVRLSSVEPNLMNEEFISELANIPEICNHFHLSLQSGSDTTLKNMNRKYDTEKYYNSVKLIKKYFDNVALTTDVIVGFPGETDENFKESFDFCEKVGFSKMHVFPYSPKKGTRACEMKNQVESQTKNERAKVLGDIDKKLSEDFAKSQVGTIQKVLVERMVSENVFEGHTTNYLNLKIKSDKNIVNTVVKVKVLTENSQYIGCIVE